MSPINSLRVSVFWEETGIRILNNTLNSGTMLSAALTGATISAPYYFGNSPEIIGSKVMLAIGTNSGAGSATLAAGTVTVSNTAITPNSIVFLSVSSIGGTQGILSYSKIAGASFTIKSSSAADTSTISWIIVD